MPSFILNDYIYTHWCFFLPQSDDISAVTYTNVFRGLVKSDTIHAKSIDHSWSEWQLSGANSFEILTFLNQL